MSLVQGMALSQIYVQKFSFLRECQGEVYSKDMPHMLPKKRYHPGNVQTLEPVTTP